MNVPQQPIFNCCKTETVTMEFIVFYLPNNFQCQIMKVQCTTFYQIFFLASFYMQPRHSEERLHTLRSSLMWLECHVPISSAFPDSPLICRHRHQNQRRSFKISPFAGSPSWKSPSRPLCARLLTYSVYKLQDIRLSSDQLSQSREILLVRHAACFSSNSC